MNNNDKDTSTTTRHVLFNIALLTGNALLTQCATNGGRLYMYIHVYPPKKFHVTSQSTRVLEHNVTIAVCVEIRKVVTHSLHIQVIEPRAVNHHTGAKERPVTSSA